METVDQTRFVIGNILALASPVLLFLARGSRGFNHRRQAGALCLFAASVFVARGLGLIEF